MKLKGINPIEANADKITLGVTGLAFLGAVALQFVPGRNHIKVGSFDKQTPGTAYVPVESAARTLLRDLETTELKLPEKVPQFTLAGKLDLSGPTLPATRIAMGPTPNIAKAEVAVKVESGQYDLPKVPAPSAPQAYAFSGTFHPIEILRNLDLKKTLVSQGQPFDFHAVSIETKFDGTALRAVLESDPDGEGPLQALPLNWWHDSVSDVSFVELVGVEVERKLLTNADGMPAKDQTVVTLPAPPGRQDSIKMWTEAVHSLGDVPGTVGTVQSFSEQFLRPEFYSTIAGAQWLPPEKALEGGDPAERQKLIQRTRDQVAQLDADIADVQKKLAAAGSSTKGAGGGRDSQPVTPPNRGGGRGASGGPANVPAPTGPKAPPTGNPLVLQRRLDALEKKRTDAAAKLDQLEGRITADPSKPATQPGTPVLQTTLTTPAITCWTHDLTGVPGATYAYRFRAVINNPLYGRNLQDGQKQMADNSLLRGEWSDWSDPIQIDPQTAVFITSAQQADVLTGRPTASAELYQFYYGYYRKGTVGLQAGDPIAARESLPATLKLADMAKLEEFVKNNQPIPGAAPAPVVPPPGGGPGGGGKGGGGMRVDPRDRVVERPAPTAAPEAAPAGPEAEWLNQAVPKQLELTSDLFFLDSTESPGQPGGYNVVVVRGDGTMYVRTPETDSKSTLLSRLRNSAQVGSTQGEIKPTETRTPRPDATPRPFPRQPQPGSGGGGGGGG